MSVQIAQVVEVLAVASYLMHRHECGINLFILLLARCQKYTRACTLIILSQTLP